MEIQKELIEKVLKNDINGVKEIMSQTDLKSDVCDCDELGMTPLQHAAYKGNKEMVRLLLDLGADVNSEKHEYKYTALHFAALSGNTDVCQLLLEHGAKTHAVNSIGRTPCQMAAFVGYHACVTVINNYVPKSDIDYYTVANGFETEPKLPQVASAPLHKFVMDINLHPVKVAINLMKSPILYENLEKVQNVLELMSHREMRKGLETNEIMSFKFHYLSSILDEINKPICNVVDFSNLENHRKEHRILIVKAHYKNEESKEVIAISGCKGEPNETGVWLSKDIMLLHKCKKSLEQENQELNKETDKKGTGPIELFIKKMLKIDKGSYPEYQENFLKEIVRKFPNTQCAIFRQMVCSLSRADSAVVLSVITSTINGQRGFVYCDGTTCATCGEEKAVKKCSKCKAVYYCDKDCQKFHWFMHKKSCGRE